MTARDFVYWLQGFFEISGAGVTSLNAEQTALVKRHLALVFVHDIDPKAGTPEVQEVLNKIHQGLKDQPPKVPPHVGGAGPGGTVYRC